MEIEFRLIDYECHNDPQLRPSDKPVLLDSKTDTKTPYEFGSKGNWMKELAHSINDPHDTFFAYQDFYVPAQGSEDADVDVTISVQQKFHERNTVDFLVEILKFNIE